MTLDRIKKEIETEGRYIHQPTFEENTNARLLEIIEALEQIRDDVHRIRFGSSAEYE